MSNSFRISWVPNICIKLFSIAENARAKSEVNTKNIKANISKTIRMLDEISTKQIRIHGILNIDLILRICSNIFSLFSHNLFLLHT